MPDKVLRDYLIHEFDISSTQAYINIQNVRILLGNVKNAGKEWVRCLVNEELKESIADVKNSKIASRKIKAAENWPKPRRTAWSTTPMAPMRLIRCSSG